ncbi:T-cell surface antigen CD2 isoform X2 [Dromiciops gliroides]|nr:T-cell surface antigen CD2 isoform X2 [Dromiciops gliroides]
MSEENVVWGILTQSISLDIPDFLKDWEVDEIRWLKGTSVIATTKKKGKNLVKNETIYEIFSNGTLRINNLEKDSEHSYKLAVYHHNGTNLLEKVLTLHVMEAVSKPTMTWNCTKRSIICEVQNRTDAELTLFDNGTQPLKKGTVKKEGLSLKYTWQGLPPREFKCVVKNQVSEEWAVGQNPCTATVLDIYHILSICGGGVILLIFLALLISCCLRRKKQNKKTNDQNLDINIPRLNMEERGRKSPGHHPQLAGGRHPQQPGGRRPQTPCHHPQAPGHRLQVPGHCPPAAGHRPQPQQKRPSPKVQQQTGPPLPRPRNQQRPPHQGMEK